MQIETWNITGQSFHFGLHGMGQEETSVNMPSDSLFAALVATLARSTSPQAAEDFCQPFKDGEPPFVLTSSLPRAGEVRFFPPPVSTRRPPQNATNGQDPKSFKRVAYVSEELFRALLDGTMLSGLNNVQQMQGGRLWLTQQEYASLPAHLQEDDAKVWQIYQRPRVTLDRASQAATLFFTGQVTFADACGLWFGIHWLKDDAALKQQVAALLQNLAEAGLGAERSNGLGAANIQPSGALALPNPTSAWTNLGRYLPAKKELDMLAHPSSAYTVQQVGGWVDNHGKGGQRRRSLNLLAEGSVFAQWQGGTPGRMEDVRPRYAKDEDPLGHTVYRNGFALAIGMEGEKA